MRNWYDILVAIWHKMLATFDFLPIKQKCMTIFWLQYISNKQQLGITNHSSLNRILVTRRWR